MELVALKFIAKKVRVTRLRLDFVSWHLTRILFVSLFILYVGCQIFPLLSFFTQGRTEKELSLLQREMEIMRSLHHPHIVKLVETIETDRDMVRISQLFSSFHCIHNCSETSTFRLDLKPDCGHRVC